MFIDRKGLIYSLIFGFLSSWFLIFVIKNPYIEEFRTLVFLEKIALFLPIVFPVIFLAGIALAQFLARLNKAIYQFGKFIEVGILNTAVDFGILNLLIWLTGITGGLAIAPLNAVSFLFTNANSYFWNKRWTFQKKEGIAGKEFVRFLTISGIGLGINTVIVAAGTGLLTPLAGLSAGAWVNAIKVLATLVSMVWNFLGYKFWVFRT